MPNGPLSQYDELEELTRSETQVEFLAYNGHTAMVMPSVDV